jgi:hypothetical protein
MMPAYWLLAQAGSTGARTDPNSATAPRHGADALSESGRRETDVEQVIGQEMGRLVRLVGEEPMDRRAVRRQVDRVAEAVGWMIRSVG